MRIVGLKREGKALVLVDANGVEHVAENAEEAWRAANAVLDDPDLGDARRASGQDVRAEAVYEDLCCEVGERVTKEYGTIAGTVAGEAMKRGGVHVARLVRSFGRRGPTYGGGKR